MITSEQNKNGERKGRDSEGEIKGLVVKSSGLRGIEEQRAS